jgi:hypothetical protein
MFCKHAEGNKINQKMKKYIFNVALWKRGKNSKCKKKQKIKIPKIFKFVYTVGIWENKTLTKNDMLFLTVNVRLLQFWHTLVVVLLAQ